MSRPLGVALIGVGMVGKTYASAFGNLTDRLTLTGAMGRSVTTGQGFLDSYELTGRAYGAIREIVDDPAVDFVILTTPPNARLDIVTALVAGGKPILMEKPVERTLPAAIEICDICAAAGNPLGIVFQHRARPSTIALKERLAVDDFGPLRLAEIAVPWWRPQSYYDALGRGTYERDGGGVMISQAIHIMDLALQFTGPVARVNALTATTELHNMESEDFVCAGLRFANGAVGSLTASTASFPGRAPEIVLHYANATARLDSNLLEIFWHDGRSETLGEAVATGAGADPMAFSSDLHEAVMVDFADALTEGRPPMATGRSALRVHALIEAIERAGRTGTTSDVAQIDKD